MGERGVASSDCAKVGKGEVLWLLVARGLGEGRVEGRRAVVSNGLLS